MKLKSTLLLCAFGLAGCKKTTAPTFDLVKTSSYQGTLAKDDVPIEAYGHSEMVAVKPESVLVGESVCVFAVMATRENHAWIPYRQFYRSRACVFIGTKTTDGWRVDLQHVKLYPHPETTDAQLKSYGWIRATEVIP